MDMAPNDVSQITAPLKQVHPWSEIDRTPLIGYGATGALTTEALQSGSWRFMRMIGEVSGGQTCEARTSGPLEWRAERDPLEAASEDRIRLLAKKFESGVNREELARLEILTARLDRLVPLVTEQDVLALEQVGGKIEDLQHRIDAFGALGLGR